MICRDKSPTGVIAINRSNSTKLLIYLQPGGACYNRDTCQKNPDHFDNNSAQWWLEHVAPSPPFSSTPALNPFADYSVIVVPYCTGDVHLGNHPNADIIGGPQNQQLVGNRNVELVLDYIDNHFEQRFSTVLLYGFSAGGFGTLYHYDRVAQHFLNARVNLVDHGGPILLDESIYPPCLDKLWQDTFRFHIPKDYSNYVKNNYPYFFMGIYEYLATKYPQAQFGLASSFTDRTIRWYYGFGQNDCQTHRDPGATAFQKAIKSLHNKLKSFGNWHVFLDNSDLHYLAPQTRADSHSFIDWMATISEGQAHDLVDTTQ